MLSFRSLFQTMDRHEPVPVQVPPLRTVQPLRSGKGVVGDVWFICFIEGQDPKIY